MSGEPLLASCFNAAFVPHLATALRSAADSASGPLRWLLAPDDSVEDTTVARLVAFARDLGIDAERLQIPGELVADFADFPPYPRMVWNRLALPEALPDEERVLYLDSDVLVLQDLRACWEVDLGDENLFGAVAQPTYSDVTGEHKRLRRGFDEPYLNTGVLLMDAARMRAERVRDQVLEFVADPDTPELRTPEQDALNLLFTDRWTALDPKWNCLTSMYLPFVFDGASRSDDLNYGETVLDRAVLAPAIVHFEGLPKLKPWHVRSVHPAADLYRQYRAMTPWPLSLEGTRLDEVLSHLPPRLQARMWTTMRRLRGQRRQSS